MNDLNQFIEDFYDILFKPSKGIARVAAERSAWQGLLVYMAISLVTAMTTVGAANRARELPSELGLFLPQETVALLQSFSPILSLISILVFYPFLLFLWASVLHLSSELLGGKGRVLNLTAAVGYAQLPYLLVAPFSLVSRYLLLDLVGLAGVIAFFWSLALKIEAIHAVHGISRVRAAAAFFLPLIAAVAAAIIFLLLISTFLMPLLMELFPL